MSVPATTPPTTRPDREHERSGAQRALEWYFRAAPVLVPVYAILVALAIGAVVILLIGENPLSAYWALLRGMFGSVDRVAASLGRSTPFIGAALAVAFAFRAGLFNIGVEGQVLVGATTAAWIGTWGFIGDVPGIVAVPIVMLAGALGGAFYGAIPGVLKARTGAHEVIVTIMLNNIALVLIRWIVNTQDPVILRDPSSSVPRGRDLPAAARLPELVHSAPPLHTGFLLMLALCLLMWFVVDRTSTGFEIRAIGANPHAARYAGMSVNRTIVLVMTVSGAFAGIAGASEIAGTTGFLSPGAFAAIGFDSIAIALLARANPFAIVPAAILWGSMLAGAPTMQQEIGLSIDVVRIIQALVLLLVAADVIIRTVFRLRRGEAGAFEQTKLTTGWGATT